MKFRSRNWCIEAGQDRKKREIRTKKSKQSLGLVRRSNDDCNRNDKTHKKNDSSVHLHTQLPALVAV